LRCKQPTRPAPTRPSWDSRRSLESPRGSEWRLWDLHLHAPGTKLSDTYGHEPDWDRFCKILEESSVAAFGIADYFCFDGFFTVLKEFTARFPKSQKVFFPNLELRLNESVNKALQMVDIHLVLRPDLDEDTANRLLHQIATEVHDPGSMRKLSCAELQTAAHFNAATVTRHALGEAVDTVFGAGRHRRDNVIVVVVVPTNNTGIRASSSEHRKANLADAIDAAADAIFGSDANSAYFLREDRYEGNAESKPKPVFSGCDAHGFDDLEAWLGKHVKSGSTYQVPTWIKGDVTFEGLQQTLVEPEERVRLQATRPDRKDPYKVISKITFNDPSTFPLEVLFNENLVSIIGSRSSGKSALLAHVAYAVDPDHTVDQQMATGQFDKPAETGPAAGHTWEGASSLTVRVEWQDPAVTKGRVIYIPQNSLFSLSARPKDITAKIVPALYRLTDDYRLAHEQVERTNTAANDAIRRAVAEWSRAYAEIAAINARIRDLGDRKAIESTKASLDAQIDVLRKESALSDADVAAFESLAATFRTMDARVAEVGEALAKLAPFVDADSGAMSVITKNVSVEIQLRPHTDEVGRDVGAQLEQEVALAREALLSKVAGILITHREALAAERQKLLDERAGLEADNAGLIKRNRASAQLDELLKRRGEQVAAIAALDSEEKLLSAAGDLQANCIRVIQESIENRAQASRPLAEAFELLPNELDGLSFGFDEALEEEVIQAISDRFNKQERSVYIDANVRALDVHKAQAEPAAFLQAVSSGTQKLVKGVEPITAAMEALVATKAIRFFARFDGDRIGGFERSSMTPGKQALFALILTLSESTEAWPLLVDQPEDDLDSRAIYNTIVPYLKDRKRERQILMVTHNANLVVGADAEQVIVTNRHGSDSKNRDGRTFDYLTGALEHSQARKETSLVLEQWGIREHACEILDGGEEAFEKRRDKYKMY
jgi:energy-coupling factor transporter ATP-binding protein EcfA2